VRNFLDGAADPQTGLQFTRNVGLGADSPRINFHAAIKNASGHPIECPCNRVSQYNTADAKILRATIRISGVQQNESSSSYLNRIM